MAYTNQLLNCNLFLYRPQLTNNILHLLIENRVTRYDFNEVSSNFIFRLRRKFTHSIEQMILSKLLVCDV